MKKLKIEIISPSKCINPEVIDFATKMLKNQNYGVSIGKNAKNRNNYFGGTTMERLNDFQNALDSNNDIIWCSRGGYGLIQYIDKLHFKNTMKKHKWLIGYSDVTVAHLTMNKIGIPTIHGTVPLDFKENTKESLDSVFNVFHNLHNLYEWNTNSKNIEGNIEAEIVGGNLSIICSLLGSNLLPNFNNKILFIEDVGEAYYSIDRMINSLRLNGIIDKISGLIVGSFSSMKDSIPKYKHTVENIILKYFQHKNIPVCFDFPAGHQKDNRAIVFGKKCRLSVKQKSASFFQ